MTDSDIETIYRTSAATSHLWGLKAVFAAGWSAHLGSSTAVGNPARTATTPSPIPVPNPND